MAVALYLGHAERFAEFRRVSGVVVLEDHSCCCSLERWTVDGGSLATHDARLVVVCVVVGHMLRLDCWAVWSTDVYMMADEGVLLWWAV